MKGILLAGGNGTRLKPMTDVISKHLLPVYDKPMIFYPLATLKQFGIEDILVISSPRDLPMIRSLLGDGTKFGVKLSYMIQEEPRGTADALILGRDFIGNDTACVIFGDCVLYMDNDIDLAYKTKVRMSASKNAIVFAYEVHDPERFGVVELDENANIVSIEEKPEKPKSNLASIGLYFFPKDALEKVLNIVPDCRGELELTDLNKIYLKEGRLKAFCLSSHEGKWLDAGTPDSLLEASKLIAQIQKARNKTVGAVESEQKESVG